MPAVTLSGFNNIDFSAILEAVMTQERAPLTSLQTKKQELTQQNTQLGTLASKLAVLQSAAAGLAKSESLAVLTSTSSDSAIVGTSTSTGTTPGVYDIVVTSKAKAQVTASSSTSSANDVVATSGTLTLLAASQPPVSIVVTGSMTLRQLADAINANADAPVTASVVQVTPGSYRLVLTGKQTGADNAFTLTSALAGGTGVAFTDTNGNGTFGEAGDGNAVEAGNASLTVNNVAVQSASNTLTDVIDGATISLNGEDATKTVRVAVTRDADGLTTKVQALIKAYNDLAGFVGDQRTAAANGNTSVGRDPLVRGLHTELRAAVLGAYGSAAVTRLAGVGIGFDRGGKMTLDTTLFKASVASDPAAVQDLFAGATADSSGGAFDALSSLVAKYTRAGGLVKTAQDRLTEQVTQITNRLDALDRQLTLRRNTLQQEFIAADQAMKQLNGQVSSLSTLGGQYRLF